MSRIQFVPDVRPEDDDSDDSGDEGTRVGQDGPESLDSKSGDSFAKPPPKKKPSDNFQASPQFQGQKPGFTYKSGPLGLGYYKNITPAAAPAPAPVSTVPKMSAPTSVSSEVSGHIATKLNSSAPPVKKGEPSALDTLRLLRSKEAEEAKNPRFTSIPADTEEPSRNTIPQDDGEPKEKKSSFLTLKKRISKTKESMKESMKRRSGGTAPDSQDDALESSTPVASTPVAVAPPQPPARTTVAPQPSTAAPPSTPAVSTPTNGSQVAGTVEARLQTVSEEFGLGLPEGVMGLPSSFANCVRVGNILYTSAHGPQLPTEGYVRGKCDASESGVEKTQVIAALTTMSVLRSVRDTLGSLNGVRRAIRIRASVVLESDDTSHLIDAIEPVASIFVKIFGENSRPVVSVVGVAALPHSIPLHVEVEFELNSQ